jgi:uncharacterized membrane protein YhaH (DUF805 family)
MSPLNAPRRSHSEKDARELLMDALNPYQSPQAPRSDDERSPAKSTLTTLLFSFDGRIPRRVYWGVTIAAWTVFWLYLIVLDLSFDDEGTSVDPIHSVLVVPALVLMGWARLALAAKRWHDRDLSGWWILINLVPFGGIYAFVQASCLRGTFGPNDYGSDPT